MLPDLKKILQIVLKYFVGLHMNHRLYRKQANVLNILLDVKNMAIFVDMAQNIYLRYIQIVGVNFNETV